MAIPVHESVQRIESLSDSLVALRDKRGALLRRAGLYTTTFFQTQTRQNRGRSGKIAREKGTVNGERKSCARSPPKKRYDIGAFFRWFT